MFVLIHFYLTPPPCSHAQWSSGLPALGTVKEGPELRTRQLRSIAKGQPSYRDSCSLHLSLSSQKFFALDLFGDPREVRIFAFPLQALSLNTSKLQLTMEQRIILVKY